MTLQPNPDSPNGQLVDDENDKWYVNADVERLMVNDQVWIAAEEFMRVQAERDALRKALAMINGVRVSSGAHWPASAPRALRQIGRFCESVGMTREDGHAINRLVVWSRAEQA